MNGNELSTGTGAGASTLEDAEVARVLDEYLAALEAGRPADPGGLLAEHPAIASQLRACLEVMRLAGRVVEPAEIPRIDGDDGTPGFSLADYRIIRQIGRGGMGIVYEAEQLSLRRRVALKVLPLASAIDARQLRRFQIEARAAAQLHHTHIVPVHAVGCERGVHYYAMPYIEGKTLAQLVRELRQIEGREAAEEVSTAILHTHEDLATLLASGQLAPAERPPSADAVAAVAPRPDRPIRSSGSSARASAYLRTVANMGIQAAEALEHAHQEGVIHRDIKPANIMVDVKGHLWITDFGLARLQNESGLTMSGDLLGTIRYMSPEQAIGHRAVVDQRADIYSLGVTLYEMVALEPAFGGTDRREVLRRIIQDNPRPIRALNPAVPRELETIIGKAMAREPESRYTTARDLADDLRRFLEYKPIRARRPSLLDRAAKWSRRHVGLVVSAVVGLCLAVIGLAISTATIAAKQAEIVRQRDEAHRQEERARQILDEMYTSLSERWLAQDPEDAELRREFLGKTAAYYEEFARTPGQSPEVRLEAAHAWLRVGLICWNLRRVPEGEAAYRLAIRRFGELAAEGRVDTREARDGENYAVYRLGDLLNVAGRKDEADALYARTIELSQAILARHPGRLTARINRASGLESLGDLRGDRAILGQAEAAYRGIIADLAEGQVDLRFLAEQFSRHRVLVAMALGSTGDAFRGALVNCYGRLGYTLGLLARLPESEDCYRRALTILQEEAARGRPVAGLAVASLSRDLAGSLSRAGRYRAAAQAYRDGLELVPNDPKAHEGLAILLADCPDLEVRDPREAIRLARRGIELRPDDGHIWQALGVAYHRDGRWSDALAALDRAISLHGCEVRDAFFLAMTHERLGHPEDARQWYRRGAEMLRESGAPNNSAMIDPYYHRLQAEVAAALGLKDAALAGRVAR